MKFYLQYEVGVDGYDLYLKIDDQFVAPLALQAKRQLGAATRPFPMVTATSGWAEKRDDNIPQLADGKAFLQAALDFAWTEGLRPQGYNDAKESNAAIDRHLQDMRALVFKNSKP